MQLSKAVMGWGWRFFFFGPELLHTFLQIFESGIKIDRGGYTLYVYIHTDIYIYYHCLVLIISYFMMHTCFKIGMRIIYTGTIS